MNLLGKKEDSSMEQLFSFFTLCLQCGDWELAQACVPQLNNTTCTSTQCLQDILKSLVTCPYVLNPHRLAWLWLKISERWAHEQVQSDSPATVGLGYLCGKRELQPVLSVCLSQELHQAFRSVQIEKKGTMVILSAEAECCLGTLLDRSRPRLAQALVHFLQGHRADDDACDRKHLLQEAFIQFLLAKVQQSGQAEVGWEEKLYSALAVMPWGPEPVEGQLHDLCRALWAASTGPLSEERVLSSLLRPRCHAALSFYCSMAVQLQRDELLKDVAASQGWSHRLVYLTEAGKLMLGLCCHAERASAWKAIYFECLSSNKHFLDQVLITALDLIRREEFSRLKDLTAAEFHPLSRLLLLLGWTHLQSLGSAQKLLETLHHSQALANDSVLKDFVDGLSSQLGVLEWCAKNTILHVLNSPLINNDDASLLGDTDTAHPVDTPNLSARRNVVLFQGFCAMKYALYAICVNAHKYSGCRDCLVAKEPFFLSLAPSGFSVLFQYYLSECQLYLEAVPALFRLELLENIFSLLFLSSADFVLSRERDIEHGLPHEQYLPSRCGLEKSDNPEFRKESKGGGVVVDWTLQQPQQPGRHTLQNLVCNYVDLGHFIQDCKGFLVDTVAMEGFLRLLRESLEGVCVVGQRDGLEEGRALAGEEEMAESLGCSVTPETFGTRLQRLSKRIAEAHWRLQVITSNHGSSSNGQIPTTKLVSRVPSLKHNGGMKRRKKSRRHRTERHSTAEQHNGEVSTSTSDGSVGVAGAPAEQEPCPCGGPHSWLIPAMLSSPESLLISCIRRGNFLEAHQVSLMFGLDGSACSGELVFMEHHRDVLVELGCVEQKIENQVADGSASGRSRLGSSGRSTLQAIGSAAAAGMAFYSISDMADMLLSTPGRPVPSLEEDYWLNHKVPDPSGVLHALLEEFSPASMATFDLACCHCLLWKTSRQLLETAERRLNTTLEGRGVRTDSTVPHSHGIKGFPAVLQQISKIINHSVSGKGSPRAGMGILFLNASDFFFTWVLHQYHISVSDPVFLCPDGRVGGGLLAALVEQASFKQSELDSHPVRSQMKQLLRTLDQLCPSEPDSAPFRPDYVRSFLDYVNTLAVVLVRSLSSEGKVEVKLGNPLLVLLQLPSQLVSHLLFDRQVSPIRVSSLLEQEGLGLNIQQVIVQRCCETLPVWETCCESMGETGRKTGGLLSLNSVKVFLQKYSQEHPLTVCPSTNSSQSSPASSSSSSSLLLTPSSLSFLKSHSPILAVLACLSACRGGAGRTGSAWPGLPAYFRSGRKEGVLDIEQVAREAEALLKDLPILHAYLQTMAQPVLGPVGSPEGSGAVSGLSASLCGLPLAGLLLSGLHRASACSAAAGAFQQALTDRDVERALNLLELYGQDSHQEQKLRDSLLACSALREGNRTMEHLFRVEDAELRARVALQGLEQWPLASCLELLRFCLSDGNTECSLKEELELKKQELQIYQRFRLNHAGSALLPHVIPLIYFACPSCQEFQLCGQWVQLYPVSMQLRLQLQTEHLLHLLERGQMEEAFQLLESLTDSALCLEVCEHALDRRPGLAACHFLADYLTLHFQDGMSPARRHLIHALHLGSKVLLTLPPDAQEDYFPLLSNPLLMLEQLLMNLKVDWAAVAVRTLRGLLLGQECIISPGDIDALLSSYARKALEFPYAPRERTRSDSVISLQDVLTQTFCRTSLSLWFHVIAGSTPVHTPCAGGGRRTKPTAYFTPPEKPPSRKDWIPDHQQSVCMVCLRERFTMFNRRHHCRRCGRLVCQACSGHRMPLEGFAEDTSRVCNQCYGFFHPLLSSSFTLQGPSSSLCIAILSLHSDHVACGHQLIDHCHSLSRGLTNPEVDARLLTDIMRQLLFSAKLMFVKAGQNQDLALCDSYISKVDVLKILVVANYKYVPSLDDISESAAITRLRNQLLEAEYYQLAVEVSTKSALDPGGVWHAWGIASLKAGSLTIAREKFARCLKAPVDRNQLNHGPRLLREIIQHLESTVWSSHTQVQDILASLRELEETLADPGSQDNSNGQGQQNCYYEECLYYLHHYGTHLAIVSFYMRHDDMKGALLHLRSKVNLSIL
uniref:Zinc finger FYVE domain-containing protein 26 n=1 Tax=Paramormyrops kingsleyae TaxID=1676925 RepID=A0A3B3RE68_9TELE